MAESILDIKLQTNPLEYRKKLTIPKKVNFGLELELDNINYKYVKRAVKNSFSSEWIVKTDCSLTENQNAEIVSPILQNTTQTWILIKKMGELLKRFDPSYDKCSFQVNFDGKLLPKIEDKIRFLKLFALYEDIIYRFSKGEDNSYRKSLETYASPIILALKGFVHMEPETTINYFSNNKRYGVVFKTFHQDLIEFRTPNMTSNTILWQNYITTFYYLLKFATSNKYDKKEVDLYIDQFYKTYLLENYELEKKEKALQLTKKIFPNQIDQVYFMHQYLRK